MIRDIIKVAARNPGTILEDAAGLSAIVLIVMVGLYLPVTF